MSISTAVRLRRAYWPKVAWVALAVCAFGVLVLHVNCYCPGYYLFWVAMCCGVIFVGRRWCSGLALVVLVFALAYTVRDYRGLQREQAIPEKSIAVLPFENLSEEKADADFAEDVRNEILTRLLASVGDLKVISRTSAAKYQSRPGNLKRVAQELGVSTILEGAVQKTGNKVRVKVHLIDARNGRYLWAESYDRDLKDVLGVESEVSQAILREFHFPPASPRP